MCSPDLVGKYLQLDARLSEFARSQVYAVDIMQNKLQVIADILVLLEQELPSDAAAQQSAFGNHATRLIPQGVTGYAGSTGFSLDRA
jgi:hypothetical protein